MAVTGAHIAVDCGTTTRGKQRSELSAIHAACSAQPLDSPLSTI
jgi:hypothetical protein